MRSAIRAPGARKPRLAVAAVGTGAAVFFLLLSMGYGAPVWRSFHTWLFAAALYMAVVNPAQHAAGLFAEERRNQTLGLIYLTGIGSLELFLTKFIGGMLVASGELLAVIPFIALPFLSGGVSLNLFLATAACLPTVLVFTLAVTIMVSILCTNESQALAWITAIFGALCLGAPVVHSLGTIVGGTAPFAKGWLALSPAYAPYLVFSSIGAPNMKLFWLAIAATWGWSVLFVSVAAWVLPRVWRDDPDAGAWRRLKNRWLQRSRDSMRRTIGANPFQWLVERNRTPTDAARSACAGIFVLWLIAWVVWKERWPSPTNLYLTALVMLVFIDIFQTNAAAQLMASHRREGIFEVLLTTPLQPQEIVDGATQGLAAQFRSLRRWLCWLFVAMALGGLFTRPWTFGALISYLMIWSVLIAWANSSRLWSLPGIMWVAVNSGRGAWALMRAPGPRVYSILSWLLIVSVFNFRGIYRWAGAGPLGFPSGSTVELLVVGFCFIVMVILKTGIGKTSNPPEMYPELISQMRSIVQHPVPSPKDPRFRHWNVKDRFPQ